MGAVPLAKNGVRGDGGGDRAVIVARHKTRVEGASADAARARTGGGTASVIVGTTSSTEKDDARVLLRDVTL